MNIHSKLAVLGVLTWLSTTTAAADWPAYRHDAGRSGFTREQLAPALHRQWTYVPRHAPRPAWPEPVREVHLMPFDYANGMVAAGGLVYFGSSADHQVHALDLATGQPRWRFFTDAPVRFAPTVYEKRLYVASDDGCVYCLSADRGRLVWRFRGAPADRRMLGNEAMISRWPLRSGLVVDRGTVYFTAGMWPSEGVYLYALDARDGTVQWKTQSPANFAPQGYLAAGEELLVAPVGRSNAWVIERATGKARAYRGMSQAIVKGDLFFAGPFPHKANENLPIQGGVPFAPRHRKMLGWTLGADKPRCEFGGKDVAAVADDAIYLAGSGKIAAHKLPGMEKKWEIDHARVFSLAGAGNTLAVGGDRRVALLETSGGRTLWSAEVDGQLRALAISGGRLLAGTHTGRIVCFGPEETANAPTVAPASGAPGDAKSPQAALAERILQDTHVTAGFCLQAGVGDGRLALELAKRSELRIYCADPDEKKVAAARELLSDAGLYGTRVTVHHVDPGTLPYPEYFANLVVVDQPPAGGAHYPSTELYRVLRPCGGTAYLVSPPLKITGDDLKETKLSAAAVKLVRGKLSGAAEWTHQYANAGKSASSGDQRVRWPLEILWFGKPGPERMMNRHWRGTAPLCVAGRMFVLGQHALTAVDAYNGRELWTREMPSIARRVVDIRGGSMVADAQSVYLAASDLCLRLDAPTGKLAQVYRIPLARRRFSLSSPQTLRMEDLGSVEIRNTNDALQLKLTTLDATVTNADRQATPARGDSWELFFDFRPREQRSGLYGPGAFQAIVVPATKEQATASRHDGLWSSAPEMQVTGSLDEKGSRTMVRIPWANVEQLLGRRPADFNFGVILNSSNDGSTPVKRTHSFANDASYRLANCRANMILDARNPGKEPAAQAELLVAEPHESLTWGNLTVSGSVILGTIVAESDSPNVLARSRDFSSEGHDYTGPRVHDVLGRIGLEGEARQVFALDEQDGRLLWTYTPQGAVPHNGIAVWKDRVYLLDKPSAAKAQRLKRRGQPATAKPSLQVLDLATGKRLWHLERGLETHVGLRLGKGILLATNMKGLTAYDADDGRELWSVDTQQPMHHCSAFLRVPVIAGNWVYDEPHAYELLSGKLRNDGSGKPWRWGGFRGCGTVSGSEHMLFFRTGTPSMLDTSGGTGRHELPGIRPGCYINIIAAGGLVLMPEASSGCGCAYNFQTTVVLSGAR